MAFLSSALEAGGADVTDIVASLDMAGSAMKLTHQALGPISSRILASTPALPCRPKRSGRLGRHDAAAADRFGFGRRPKQGRKRHAS